MFDEKALPAKRLVLMVGGLLLASCQRIPPPLTIASSGKAPNSAPLDPDVEAQFWKVRGERVVNSGGESVRLTGFAFGNQVWSHVEVPSAHHAGEDYARLAKMGFNTVRFYMSYRSFEEDDAPGAYKESGLLWLDQNVQWAKSHGVRLILNLHAAPGGMQAEGKGDDLWKNAEMQDRFVALWRMLAERYRAEPTIVGYDILNAPSPIEGISQWLQLAQRTAQEIREVDQHHILFIDRVIAVGGNPVENEERNFVRIEDANTVYEFHFYKPYHFTHQNAHLSQYASREGWYPDEEMLEVDPSRLKLEASVSSPALPPGRSDWQMVSTEPFVNTGGQLAIGKPILVCDRGVGEAFFDSLKLTKLSPKAQEARSLRGSVAVRGLDNGSHKKSKTQSKRRSVFSGIRASEESGEEKDSRLPETLFELDLDTIRGFRLSAEGEGAKARFIPQGREDLSALGIYGAVGKAALGSDPLRFTLSPGAEYQLEGWVRGEGLAEDSNCGLRLEFYSSSVPILSRNKAFLRQELDAYLSWGAAQGVPLYLAEFGTIRDSFLQDRGGAKWVQDMLELLDERDVSYAYHAYHEKYFGLFIDPDSLPDDAEVNPELLRIFMRNSPEASSLPVKPTRVDTEDTMQQEQVADDRIDFDAD